MLPVLRNGGWNLWTQSLVSIWGYREKIMKKTNYYPQYFYYFRKKNKDKILNLRASRVYLVFCDDE